MPVIDDDEATPEQQAAHDARIVRCTSCNARIIFLKTEAGRPMPVDADTVQIGETLYHRNKHDSHFGSCPNANSHRRKRP